MSSCSSPQSEAVMSVHGEVSQKSIKCENVRNVSRPMFYKSNEIVQIDCLLLKYGKLIV